MDDKVYAMIGLAVPVFAVGMAVGMLWGHFLTRQKRTCEDGGCRNFYPDPKDGLCVVCRLPSKRRDEARSRRQKIDWGDE